MSSVMVFSKSRQTCQWELTVYNLYPVRKSKEQSWATREDPMIQEIHLSLLMLQKATGKGNALLKCAYLNESIPNSHPWPTCWCCYCYLHWFSLFHNFWEKSRSKTEEVKWVRPGQFPCRYRGRGWENHYSVFLFVLTTTASAAVETRLLWTGECWNHMMLPLPACQSYWLNMECREGGKAGETESVSQRRSLFTGFNKMFVGRDRDRSEMDGAASQKQKVNCCDPNSVQALILVTTPDTQQKGAVGDSGFALLWPWSVPSYSAFSHNDDGFYGFSFLTYLYMFAIVCRLQVRMPSCMLSLFLVHKLKPWSLQFVS